MINWLANPARFMRLSAKAVPWCGWAAVLVLAVGLFWSLVVAPPDYQQGDTVRIMYVHVPAAWMALSVYLFVAVASAVALVWRHPLAEVAARAAAPIGAAFTFRLPRHRLAVGPPDVGRLVGVGRPADLGADLVLSLPRLHCAGERLRRSLARRQGGRGAGAGRGGQPADHQVLRRLVEHSASAGERLADRRAHGSTSRCSPRC